MTAAIADAISPATTPAPLDEGAFSEEFVGLLPSMRAFARSLCRNRAEADDLAQTAMMNAWRARHSYTPGTNLRAWLYTILRNQYISERRRAAAWRSTISVEDTVLPVPQNQEAKVEMNDLQSALMKLPEEQREALILVGAGGFAYHEAAELCGCAVGTIKSRVARARRALTAIMGAGMMGNGAEAQGSPSEGKEPEGARIDDAKSETHTEA